MVDIDQHVSSYDFELPAKNIAHTPRIPRDSSKFLVLDKESGQVSHRIFRELDEILLPTDVLVINETRVEPRRLLGHKKTGGKLEVLLLEKKGVRRWECKVRPGISVGISFEFFSPKTHIVVIQGTVIAETEDGNRIIEFSDDIELKWDEIGILPIPPYIKGYDGDEELYQTIYAKEDGSVAAPTAGRHFTPDLMDRLRKKGVVIEKIYLHVSRDTAFPIIKTEKVSEVHVHSEQVYISTDVSDRLNQYKKQGRRIIAVGTTSTRSLEGVSSMEQEKGSSEDLIAPFSGHVDLFISPGYKFKFIDGMITNFHFAKSSLIMLVSAFVGRKKLLEVYKEAIDNDYRFYSFGDVMMVL